MVKPVDGFAGIDVWLVESGRCCRALAESATAGGRHVIVQEYLPSVVDGNKRLFLGGRRGGRGDVPQAVGRRLPDRPTGRGGADRRRGTSGSPRPWPRGWWRTASRSPGLDVIDGRLIEVNVTCPGGMHKADALLGTDLSGAIVRRLLGSSICTREELLS